MINPNPFKTVWTSPRDTIRNVVAQNPELYVTLLACLVGVGKTLDRASMRNLGDRLPTPAILIVACLVGPLSGILTLWISSHLVRWTGRWIGGTAPREHIKAAIAWGSVPAVFALVFWIPELLIVGSEMFTSETPLIDAEVWRLVTMLGLAFAQLVCGVWSLVLICNTIAEVQSYRSAWRGFGNILLAGCVVGVPLIGLIALAMMIKGA